MSTSTLTIIPKPWPEVQAILPPLSKSERRSLWESIQKSGVQQPILILPDGRIIDGHHRWELSGQKAVVEVRDIGEQEAFALALALNVARRQMSPEQLRSVHERLRHDAELRKQTALQMRQQGLSQEQTAAAVGIPQQTLSRWEDKQEAEGNNTQMGNASLSEPTPSESAPTLDLRITVPKPEYQRVYERAQTGESYAAIAADYHVTERRIGQIVNIVEERNRPAPTLAQPVPLSPARARCIVLDPPWPIEKIEREERPKQGPSLDYPTMSEAEIFGLPVAALADPSGCHVYLWVTHRFLPLGLRCFEAWGVRYQCLMTWVKNVGFTPYSWMYSTEHVLFGRIGSLDLLRLGVRLDFTGKVREHSRKPDEFFSIVQQVSPGPRLEMFARETREGFIPWGNQIDHFAMEETKGVSHLMPLITV